MFPTFSGKGDLVVAEALPTLLDRIEIGECTARPALRCTSSGAQQQMETCSGAGPPLAAAALPLHSGCRRQRCQPGRRPQVMSSSAPSPQRRRRMLSSASQVRPLGGAGCAGCLGAAAGAARPPACPAAATPCSQSRPQHRRAQESHASPRCAPAAAPSAPGAGARTRPHQRARRLTPALLAGVAGSEVKVYRPGNLAPTVLRVPPGHIWLQVRRCAPGRRSAAPCAAGTLPVQRGAIECRARVAAAERSSVLAAPAAHWAADGLPPAPGPASRPCCRATTSHCPGTRESMGLCPWRWSGARSSARWAGRWRPGTLPPSCSWPRPVGRSSPSSQACSWLVRASLRAGGAAAARRGQLTWLLPALVGLASLQMDRAPPASLRRGCAAPERGPQRQARKEARMACSVELE
jgi:hypothetical protein